MSPAAAAAISSVGSRMSAATASAEDASIDVFATTGTPTTLSLCDSSGENRGSALFRAAL